MSIHQTNGAPSHASCNANAAGQRQKQLQEWIAQIQALPDPVARELFFNCLQSVLALHHDGLAKILQLIDRSGAAGGEIGNDLANDELVRSLLLIHGLHPVPLETRLHAALEKVRPYMKSHGGNVELIRAENDVAWLHLVGACNGCPSSSVTMELALRQSLEEMCPDLAGCEVEGMAAQNGATAKTPEPRLSIAR